jgi:transcriptional regulator with XRE-family HTH domain
MLQDDIAESATRLGENIRTWRKLLGLRAEQVAQRADISLAIACRRDLINKRSPGRRFNNLDYLLKPDWLFDIL